MTQRKTKKLAIAGGCHFTTNGINSLLKHCFFQSGLVVYEHLGDIHEDNDNVQIIAVINECNINYRDIQWLERWISKAGKENMLILCHEVLQKILSCVFKIDCIYVAHNAPIGDIKEALIRLLLEKKRVPHCPLNAKLTGIESRILMMLVEGFSVKEISEIRHKNIKTISSLKSRLMRKMGMPNTLKTLSIISIYMKSLTSSGFRLHH